MSRKSSGYVQFEKGQKLLEKDFNLPPVTSSPIDRVNVPPASSNEEVALTRTWRSLLTSHQQPAGPLVPDKSQEKVRRWLDSIDTSVEKETSVASGTSFEPVFVHKLHISLTPKAKTSVISDGTRRLRGRDIRVGDDTADSSGERILDKVRQEMEHGGQIDTVRIEHLQRLIADHLKKQATNEVAEPDNSEDADFMDFLQSNLENLRVSPSTKRILQQKQREQQKRILSLAITKRRSAAEIQKKIREQQSKAEKQKISRVQQEVDIEEATKRRQAHLKSVTLKLRANNTVHQRNAEKTRKRKKLDQVQRVLKSEELKTTDQSNKIVKDVWEVLMKEQYKQLLQDVRQYKEEHKEYAEQAAEQLRRYKANYEEHLREIRAAAARDTALMGSQRKDIDREIRKLRHELKLKFTAEYENLLQKIRNRGEHHRWLREEKADRLKSEIQTAKYTFDL